MASWDATECLQLLPDAMRPLCYLNGSTAIMLAVISIVSFIATILVLSAIATSRPTPPHVRPAKSLQYVYAAAAFVKPFQSTRLEFPSPLRGTAPAEPTILRNFSRPKQTVHFELWAIAALAIATAIAITAPIRSVTVILSSAPNFGF
ncbi:hypothetical protein ACG7TL_005844 [Trametes sanguinea]